MRHPAKRQVNDINSKINRDIQHLNDHPGVRQLSTFRFHGCPAFYLLPTDFNVSAVTVLLDKPNDFSMHGIGVHGGDT